MSWNYEQVTAVGTGRAGLGSYKLVLTVPGDHFQCTGLTKAEAERFRHLVEERLHEALHSPGFEAPEEGGSGSGQAADRLARLQDLHDKGLISSDEFEAKRLAILDEL